MVSRIIALLKVQKHGLSFGRIAAKLYLSPREKSMLREHLNTLEAGGIVIQRRKRYVLRERANIIRGNVITSQPGFVFVRPEGETSADIYIPTRHTGTALLGDSVEVFVKTGKRGKPEGRITRILEKKKDIILGLYKERAGQPFIRPFEPHLAEDISVKMTSGKHVQEGTIVSLRREDSSLDRIFGRPDDPGIDTQVVIISHNLNDTFSPGARAEAVKIPSRIQEKALQGRTDHRDWTTVTIDGEKAQDFDDAVSIRELRGGNVLLGVHVADVSHYVERGSELDREALNRGTSVYFPDSTLPMFPEKVSNEICSLLPREDRLTVSVCLEIDHEGNIVKANFSPSLIRTQERMTYTSVFKILEGNEEEREQFRPLVQDLLLMNETTRRLRKKRLLEGSLDFDLTEPELIYEGEILHGVMPGERNEAHRLIEEFMVAANEAVANYLTSRNCAMIYRVHPPPSVEALSKLEKILASFDLSLPPPKKVSSRDLQRVLEEAAGKEEENFVNFQLLRSQKIAFYSAENEGHFGLAKDIYTHFTSPIRRYPDLVVHRALKSTLRGEKADLNSLELIARRCSELQRNAEAAERALIEWRIFRFLKGKLGDLFEGIVTGVARAGLVVELKNYFASGWIPADDLGQTFFFRKTEKKLVSRKTGKTIGLGDLVCVRLDAVDPLLRRMTLALCDS